ncbi:MAG: LppX_LprAFG lipoprotein [Aeromicrobium sp.]|uniref:LppX_LprAFG lipoprotein n=1 Tax=Aeromicrobium sp. TaxID=1871063 RepID=UPI0039E2670C
MRTFRIPLLVVAVTVFALTACSGQTKTDLDPGNAAKRLDAAAEVLAQAERLDFSLTVDGSLPKGVDGLESATGFGNRTPAFDGEVKIANGSSSLSADVISVDGQVWAKLGFSPSYFTIDPGEYGAPDPAALIGKPGEGVAALLSRIEVGEVTEERDGKDVLTTITGTVAGTLIAELIPSADADADYDVTVRLTEDDEVHDVTLTGSFYPGQDDVTYIVTVLASSESATITAP